MHIKSGRLSKLGEAGHSTSTRAFSNEDHVRNWQSNIEYDSGLCFFTEKIKSEEDNSSLRLKVLVRFPNTTGLDLAMLGPGH